MVVLLLSTALAPAWAAGGPRRSRAMATGQPAAAIPEWTILVYLDGDNDLDDVVEADLQEMEDGVPAHVRLLILVDRANTSGSQLWECSKGVRRLHEEGPEPDMGDWQTLARFLDRGLALAPASHIALIIWNHGMGWKHPEGAATRGIASDDTSGSFITADQLGLALREGARRHGRRLDVVAFDACLMQMVEVAWAVHRWCDVLIGSEEVVPRAGFPYDRFLGGLPVGADAEKLARHWVDTYLESYRQKEPQPVALSAWRCRDLPAVFDAVNGLAKALLTTPAAGPVVKSVLQEVQRFTARDHIDLGHFGDLLGSRLTDETIRTALEKLRIALDRARLCANHTGGHLRHSQGLAIYFPSRSAFCSPSYQTLEFARMSQWDDWLAHYHAWLDMSEEVARLETEGAVALPEVVRRVEQLARSHPEVGAAGQAQIRFWAVHQAEGGRAAEVEAVIGRGWLSGD
ncbi:MAG: Cysteine protease [Candidatus Ozemobacter sibiricus]|uniref:Cysteine protease n=1 Tax=Candidatus Ozemobacter sibiricus TaxID=2268124 RepID=A0A367ZJS5_9BACT|nr:MAG: Cysteine protease [Candidatus Ozemobacter sibiricus]